MKLGFITHPITTKDGVDTVDLTLMDQLSLDKGDDQVVVRWTRKKGGEWSEPFRPGEDLPLGSFGKDGRMVKAVDALITEDDDLNDPDALLVRWVREGIAMQVVYDPRFKKFVDVTKLRGEGKEQWAPDGVTTEISVMAKDEEEAQSRIMSELAKDDDNADIIASWMKSKRKVKRISEGKLPTVHPDTVYCKRGHQRAALEKKQPVKKDKPAKEAKAK